MLCVCRTVPAGSCTLPDLRIALSFVRLFLVTLSLLQPNDSLRPRNQSNLARKATNANTALRQLLCRSEITTSRPSCLQRSSDAPQFGDVINHSHWK